MIQYIRSLWHAAVASVLVLGSLVAQDYSRSDFTHNIKEQPYRMTLLSRSPSKVKNLDEALEAIRRNDESAVLLAGDFSAADLETLRESLSAIDAHNPNLVSRLEPVIIKITDYDRSASTSNGTDSLETVEDTITKYANRSTEQIIGDPNYKQDLQKQEIPIPTTEEEYKKIMQKLKNPIRIDKLDFLYRGNNNTKTDVHEFGHLIIDEDQKKGRDLTEAVDKNKDIDAFFQREFADWRYIKQRENEVEDYRDEKIRTFERRLWNFRFMSAAELQEARKTTPKEDLVLIAGLTNLGYYTFLSQYTDVVEATILPKKVTELLAEDVVDVILKRKAYSIDSANRQEEVLSALATAMKEGDEEKVKLLKLEQEKLGKRGLEHLLVREFLKN